MAEQFRVVVTDYIRDDLAIERAVLDPVARVEALMAHEEDELRGRVEEADALIVFHEVRLTPRTIERLQRCRLIVRAGVGVDNVDIRFARQRNIPVANVPDYGSEEVADTAIGLTLALARGIHIYNSRLRAGGAEWDYRAAAPLVRLRGRGFGIVGLGRIGTAAALRAKVLGMDVAFYDPYKPDGYERSLGIRRVETLEELLARSLVLSIHCPLTDETRHMIDREALAQMLARSYLVNTARGAIVDPAALLEALTSGPLAGAGIDVLEREPPPADDPLLCAWRDPGHPAHHRLILNPHAAFYSEEGIEDMRRKSAEACRRALLGLPVRNVVN